MKTPWVTKRLGEIIRLEYGRPLSDSQRRPEGKYPVYGANGIKTWTDKHYYDKQSIIIGRKGSAGEIKITETKFWPLDVTYFVTFSENEYDLFFLYYLLSTLNIPKLAKGVKPGINRNDVYEIEVEVPSLKEQQHLVVLLDNVFDKIAKAKENTEKNLQNSKEFFESYLQSIFQNPKEDWLEYKLSECFKLKSGDNLTSKSMVGDGKFAVYGGNGVAGFFNRSNLLGNNIIIGRVGALCGNVRHIKENIWLTDNAFKVTDLKYDFDNDFLSYLLNYKDLRSYARHTAQPVISNSSLANVLLQFPKTKKEQKDISSKLNKLSAENKKLKSIYKQKLLALEELKESILSKAFNGEL